MTRGVYTDDFINDVEMGRPGDFVTIEDACAAIHAALIEVGIEADVRPWTTTYPEGDVTVPAIYGLKWLVKGFATVRLEREYVWRAMYLAGWGRSCLSCWINHSHESGELVDCSHLVEWA